MSAAETASILVLYPRPSNTEEFVEYYTEQHLPKVEKMPGLLSYSFSTEIAAPDGTDADHFAVFVGDFPSTDALAHAMTSPEGIAVADDVGAFATGGAILATAVVQRPRPPVVVATQRYLDAWNAHDVDAVVACFDAQGRYTDSGLGDREIGPAELGGYLTKLFAQVPDLQMDIITIDATSDGGASAFWRGAGGADAAHPDGRLSFLGADLLRFSGDGSIVHAAALYDAATFRAQLGAEG